MRAHTYTHKSGALVRLFLHFGVNNRCKHYNVNSDTSSGINVTKRPTDAFTGSLTLIQGTSPTLNSERAPPLLNKIVNPLTLMNDDEL